MVMRLPEKDQLSMRKDQMKAHLLIATGGRIAEEMILVKIKLQMVQQAIYKWLQIYQKK